MKSHHALIVLFALLFSSCWATYRSYHATSQRVNEELDRALTLTMQQQESYVITQDTLRTFNSLLQIPELRGKASLLVDVQAGQFKASAHCSEATIFGLSDQKPATMLWIMTGLWALMVCYHRKRSREDTEALIPLPLGNGFTPNNNLARNTYGGLTYSENEHRFYAATGHEVPLTPMQQQLMEMFFASPSHTLTKTEICDALWPRKPDASDTLYTLIRRLRPIIEQHSDLCITSDRSRAYRLIHKDIEH